MTSAVLCSRITPLLFFLVFACSRPPKPPIEDLLHRENLSSFTLREVRGTRDGDRLHAQASFSDGASTLSVDLRFTVGASTHLQSGQWSWPRNGAVAEGTVTEHSVMFLGGQDGPPSVGGSFDLLNTSAVPAYRINIPTTQLKTKL